MKTSILSLIIISLFIFSTGFSQNGRNFRNSNKSPNEVVSIKGTLTSLNHPVAIVKGDDGKDYETRLGPIWYWNQNNLSLNEKGKVEIKGELEKSNSKNYIYPYTIIQGGKTITLADNNGLPLWAGNGKGMGRMNGKGKMKGNGNMRGNGNCGRMNSSNNN